MMGAKNLKSHLNEDFNFQVVGTGDELKIGLLFWGGALLGLVSVTLAIVFLGPPPNSR